MPVILPGFIVHVPLAGKPLKVTLPVAMAQVGWVMVPTTGAVGNGFTVAITAVLPETQLLAVAST